MTDPTPAPDVSAHLTQRLTDLRSKAQAVVGLGLTGEWSWFGNVKHGSPYLATRKHGQRLVLGPAVRHDHVTYTEDYDDVENVETPDNCTTSSCDYFGADAAPESDAEQRTHTKETPTFAFPVQQDHCGHPMMQDAHRIARYAVAPEATDENDPKVYRHDVTGFRSPTADYLAAADASLVADLIEQLRLHQVALRVALEHTVAHSSDEAAKAELDGCRMVLDGLPRVPSDGGGWVRPDA